MVFLFLLLAFNNLEISKRTIDIPKNINPIKEDLILMQLYPLIGTLVNQRIPTIVLERIIPVK